MGLMPPCSSSGEGWGLSETLCEWYGVTSAVSGRGLAKITHDYRDHKGAGSTGRADAGPVSGADQLVAAARRLGVELTCVQGRLVEDHHRLKTVYTAATLTAAEARFAEFAQTWRGKYPALIAMWERSWAEFVPLLDFPVEIDALVYTTNGIESLNSRFRQAVRPRGHFPTEQAAMKILYLTVRERRPNRSNPTGKIINWKRILNSLAITYCDRLNLN
jgi:hypothetical protein